MEINSAVRLLDRQSSKVAALCEPLRLIGVDAFSVIKSYDQGKIVNLSSIPGWVEAYYKEELYKTSLFEDFPGNYLSGTFYFLETDDSKVVRFARENFGCYACYSIILRSNDNTSFYFFSLNEKNKNNFHVYLRSSDLLYKFVCYFNQKISGSIPSLLVDKVDLYDDIYIPSKLVLPSYRAGIERFNALVGGEEQLALGLPKVTERESICLRYLLEGFSAKEIAKKMSISSRSVEFHINNLKKKFDCRNSVALISKIYADHYEYAMLLQCSVD
ncbi:MAG: helix-turn-helix transcriptional regulator [Gammaproteobacteria bacterium]